MTTEEYEKTKDMLTAWANYNSYVRQYKYEIDENIKLSKKHSTERIDGAVAAVMALDRAVRNGGQQGSVYDSRGIIVF
mgnify:FL=1